MLLTTASHESHETEDLLCTILLCNLNLNLAVTFSHMAEFFQSPGLRVSGRTKQKTSYALFFYVLLA